MHAFECLCSLLAIITHILGQSSSKPTKLNVRNYIWYRLNVILPEIGIR